MVRLINFAVLTYYFALGHRTGAKIWTWFSQHGSVLPDAPTAHLNNM